MSINSSVNGNTITISINGRFDFSSHKEFREAYRNLPEGSSHEFIVDMSATDYLDSSALGMMLLLREHGGSEQANITIKNCSSEVKEILMVSNFDKLFKIS